MKINSLENLKIEIFYKLYHLHIYSRSGVDTCTEGGKPGNPPNN